MIKKSLSEIDFSNSDQDYSDFSIGHEMENRFYFSSPFRSLSTHGELISLSTPAIDGFDSQGQFQRDLQSAFAKAKASGIHNPIVCGAIPFDKSKPSALCIPSEVKWHKKPTLNSECAKYQRIKPDELKLQFLPDYEGFTAMVSSAVNSIRAGILDKVVLSRLLEIEAANPFLLEQILSGLISHNPQNFHFSVPIGQACLVGASPELLLRKKGECFYSHPLAGSAARQLDPSQDRYISEKLLRSEKDLLEHKFVTNGIAALLKKRVSQLHVPHQPSLFKTATMWHLGSEIRGMVVNESESALTLASLLHPTPALCGAPTDRAYQLIAELEPFDRGLFGGIVGWCDSHGDGEWVVAIRCCIMQKNRLKLFAGAGIVQDSNPDSEWQETGNKLRTVLNVLGIDF